MLGGSICLARGGGLVCVVLLYASLTTATALSLTFILDARAPDPHRPQRRQTSRWNVHPARPLLDPHVPLRLLDLAPALTFGISTSTPAPPSTSRHHKTRATRQNTVDDSKCTTARRIIFSVKCTSPTTSAPRVPFVLA
ncbi:hypothetical protein B0H13DRAFT_2332233 [Mycena leptocephala]|nr:hypothetical protein B0H13DRAFT_2332233 [Mycena leptocephala]